jgi:hypothetical protein
MKAIKIDSLLNTITEIEISDDFRDISRNIGCDLFCVGHVLANGDTLFVDDEGWINTNVTRAFGFAGRILAGNGLVLGCDGGGESVNVKSTLEEVRKLVEFPPVGWMVTDEMRDDMCKMSFSALDN